MENLSRRSFLALGTLGAASAAAGLAGWLPQTKGSASTDLATTGNRSSEPINSSGIEVNPDEVVEVIETNIVIVGGGLSGLAAAVQAAENGDDFILLEAQATLGGNGQGVEGTFAVDSVSRKSRTSKSIAPSSCRRTRKNSMGGRWPAVQGSLRQLGGKHRMARRSMRLRAGRHHRQLPLRRQRRLVDTFHWWKDGAAYVGYVMPMQQKLRDAAADIRLNNRALEFSYDENGAINGERTPSTPSATWCSTRPKPSSWPRAASPTTTAA